MFPGAKTSQILGFSVSLTEKEISSVYQFINSLSHRNLLNKTTVKLYICEFFILSGH